MSLKQWAKLNGWSEQELSVYVSQLEPLTCERSCYFSFAGVCARDLEHGINPLECFRRHQYRGYEREAGSDEIEIIEAKLNDK